MEQTSAKRVQTPSCKLEGCSAPAVVKGKSHGGVQLGRPGARGIERKKGADRIAWTAQSHLEKQVTDQADPEEDAPEHLVLHRR